MPWGKVNTSYVGMLDLTPFFRFAFLCDPVFVRASALTGSPVDRPRQACLPAACQVVEIVFCSRRFGEVRQLFVRTEFFRLLYPLLPLNAPRETYDAFFQVSNVFVAELRYLVEV